MGTAHRYLLPLKQCEGEAGRKIGVVGVANPTVGVQGILEVEWHGKVGY